MSLKVAGSMVSVVGNATAGTITYQSLTSSENPNAAMAPRQLLLKLDGDGDFTIPQLSITELGDLLGGVPYGLTQLIGAMLVRENTVFPPSFEVDLDVWPILLNVPLGYNSYQMTGAGLLQSGAGDTSCKGGNIPKHEKLDITISRRGQHLRMTIAYLGDGENPPESQVIDAAITPGYEPYILLACGVLPNENYQFNVPFSADYTFTPNSTPLVDFNGLKDGFYLDSLEINNGKFEIANHMLKLAGWQADTDISTYGNAVLNDGDRIRYRVNGALSDSKFTFGLRAAEYLSAGGGDQHQLWDNSSWLHRRVFDALTYNVVNGTVSRNDPLWSMEYNAGPDAIASSIYSFNMGLTDISNTEFVVCRIGDQYIRYLQEVGGDKLDFKRFNQLPNKPNYQVASFLTIDTLPTYSSDGNYTFVPDKGFDLTYVRETIPLNEREELLALSSSLVHDQSLVVTADYTSAIVDERGSISYKPGNNGQASADFPINLGTSGFFELEFDPADRNKSYYLKLTHRQPYHNFDYMLVSIHSPDGIQPHQLTVATYIEEGATFELNYGNAAWSQSVTRAGVMLNILQYGNSTYLDVSRHTPNPDGHVPLNGPFPVILGQHDLLANLNLTVVSHTPTVPGSWICNYNKSDFKLKKTWLGYTGGRQFMGNTIYSTRHLQVVQNSPVQQGDYYVGTMNWKILPETVTPWHREEPPEGGTVDRDSQTATGLTNFTITATPGLDRETEAPFASHADARFYIVNNPILATYMDSFATNTTYWRVNATIVRNVGNVIYLDEYDHCAEIINRTTLATITGDDQLENYRFNWKTVVVGGKHVIVCQLQRNGQVIWTSPNYPAFSTSEVWGKYIAVFYEVHTGFDMSNGYILPDTQYKLLLEHNYASD